MDNTTLSVHSRESDDVTHGQKVYGIPPGMRSGHGSRGQSHQGELAVDYDELDSLANGIDYISKVTWGVTQPLNGFEASYTTRSGVSGDRAQ